ncbi:hypothetical protein BR93DRAFT_958406 [Coniochaeta sp. PMI_546]|nr:hypothetical protein BR93DRAFT_958406 [Coniochaeta sp. PMI_546]
MAMCPNFDMSDTCVHDTKVDLDFTIRTNNGWLFDCRLDPTHFIRSPRFTKEYMKVINVLRSDDGVDDGGDYYEEDAYVFLKEPFGPLIAKLAPGTLPLPPHGRPSLSQYLFPARVCCTLDVIDDKARPRQTEMRHNRWGEPGLRMHENFLRELRQWQGTNLINPNSVQIKYDDPKEILIAPPRQVVVPGPEGTEQTYYYKPFRRAHGTLAVEHELRALSKITTAGISRSKALICHLHGVVADGIMFFGMLLTWIDAKTVLSSPLAEITPVNIRNRWATQISESLHELHKRGLVWGDVKAENVLIDKEDNAWLTDFGPGYTEGWVDKHKVGTVEGDLQGLAKIMAMLR